MDIIVYHEYKRIWKHIEKNERLYVLYDKRATKATSYIPVN